MQLVRHPCHRKKFSSSFPKIITVWNNTPQWWFVSSPPLFHILASLSHFCVQQKAKLSLKAPTVYILCNNTFKWTIYLLRSAFVYSRIKKNNFKLCSFTYDPTECKWSNDFKGQCNETEHQGLSIQRMIDCFKPRDLILPTFSRT